MNIEETLLLILGCLLAIVILTSIALRVRIPYPIVLVIGGGLLGFVPISQNNLHFDPNIVLSLFLPPLVYYAAWTTSWRDFHANQRSIFFLAIGLVLVNMLVVAVVAHYSILNMPWAVAFVLGAIVSPTDTVAAGTVLQSVSIPRRISTMIEGEGLINDAVGLVAYRFALAAVVSGAFSLWQAGLSFFFSSVGGIILGLLVAWPIAWLHRRIDDPTREILLTILTPFLSYLLAEAIGLSGVLATVATGLYLSRQSSTFFSPATRLQAQAFWNVLNFLFNGFIFLIIGWELHELITTLFGISFLTFLGYAAIICLTVILVRLLWVFLATMLFRVLPWIDYPRTNWRSSLLIGWSGMRGGVSLAIAVAIPLTIQSGQNFPQRDLVILLTFSVILVTLIVQGLSLSPLIRMLDLQPDTSERQEERKAMIKATQTAHQRIQDLSGESWFPQDYARRLDARYHRLVDEMHPNLDHEDEEQVEHIKQALDSHRRLREEVLQSMRSTVIEMRDRGEIGDAALHNVERQLDLRAQELKR
jgi:Na+/H+ antiporter